MIRKGRRLHKTSSTFAILISSPIGTSLLETVSVVTRSTSEEGLCISTIRKMPFLFTRRSDPLSIMKRIVDF